MSLYSLRPPPILPDFKDRSHDASSRRTIAVGPFTYADPSHVHRHGIYVTCRSPDCSDCALDTATVHIDCLNLFSRTASIENKMYRLWAVSTGRYPWPGGPSPLLLPKPNVAIVMKHVGDATDFARLNELPSDIGIMVLEILATCTHDFLRLCAVLDLVEKLTFTVSQPNRQRMPLSRIESWTRGGVPSVAISAPDTPLTLTFDSMGIRTLARGSDCEAQTGSDLLIIIKPGPDTSSIASFEVRLKSSCSLRTLTDRTSLGSAAFNRLVYPINASSGTSPSHWTSKSVRHFYKIRRIPHNQVFVSIPSTWPPALG